MIRLHPKYQRIFCVSFSQMDFWVRHIAFVRNSNHWSLSDSKSIVWISISPFISKFSSPFTNPLVTVTRAPITIGITVIFMFHSFFSSLARSWYLSFFLLPFNFALWSAGTGNSTILQVLSFLLLLMSGCLAEIR